MKRGEILDAVKRTITKDRNNRHGEPENSFPRIAKEWNDYLHRAGCLREWIAIKPSDVAEMLAIFKTCRFEMQPDNPDNEHDRIGYYAIAAELRAVERKTAPVLNQPAPPPQSPIYDRDPMTWPKNPRKGAVILVKRNDDPILDRWLFNGFAWHPDNGSRRNG